MLTSKADLDTLLSFGSFSLLWLWFLIYVTGAFMGWWS